MQTILFIAPSTFPTPIRAKTTLTPVEPRVNSKTRRLFAHLAFFHI
jgi:hypothetical protein